MPMSLASRASMRIPIDKGVTIYRTPRSACWYLAIHRSGKLLRQTLHTRNKHNALLIAHQRAEELLSVRNQVVMARDPLMDRLLDEYKRRIVTRNSPATRRLNMDNLKRIAGFVRRHLTVKGPLRLSHYSPDVLDAYMAERRGAGISASTINRDRSTLSSLFRFARRRRLIRMNPIEVVEPLPDIRRRLPVTLSEKEADNLLKEAGAEVPLHGRGKKGKGNSRPRLTPLHDLILFALNTGARLGEILHLEWDDVDLKEAQVNIVNKEVHSIKDRRDRVIRANRLVVEMLERRRRERRPHISWVFPSLEHGVLDRRNVLREFKRAAVKAEIEWANFLILRHTALTALAKAGTPGFILREIAGHASLRTTERYYIGNVGGDDWSPPELGRPAFR